MPEGKWSHYSSKTWRCRIEDGVNGATRWGIVQGERLAINVHEFRTLEQDETEKLAVKRMSASYKDQSGSCMFQLSERTNSL